MVYGTKFGPSMFAKAISGMKAKHDEKQRGNALTEAMQRMQEAENAAGRMDAIAGYAAQGYDPRDVVSIYQAAQPMKPNVQSVRGGLYNLDTGGWMVPPEAAKPDFSQYREVGGGLYDMASGKWQVPPQPKPSYSHLKSVGGGLYNMDTGQWQVRPEDAPKAPKDYGAPEKLVKDSETGGYYNAYDDEFSNTLYGHVGLGDGEYLDPAIERKVRDRADTLFRSTGDYRRSVQQAAKEVGLPEGKEGYAPYETEGMWNPFADDQTFYRPKGSQTRSGGNSVIVSNGKETFRIPADKVEEAKKDGFNEVY